MDRIFVHLPGVDGSVIANLLQVVRVSDITDDQMVLNMSDGSRLVVHNADMVKHLTALICDHAMTVDGRAMRIQVEEETEPTKS